MLIGLGLCLVSAGPASIRLYLSGTVHFKEPHAEWPVQGLSLFVKANGLVVANGTIGEDGKYSISFIPEDQPSFDFYSAGVGHDTPFIQSFTRFESDVMTWDIEL